jgi:hypothetical protein
MLAIRRTGALILLVLIVSVGTFMVACGDDDDDVTETPTSSGGAKFIIAPERGYPDQRIHLAGCGFAPDAELTLEATNSSSFPNFTTDAAGAFSFEAQVPSVGPGTFVVRASTSEDVFAETVFEVTQQGGDNATGPAGPPTPQIPEC